MSIQFDCIIESGSKKFLDETSSCLSHFILVQFLVHKQEIKEGCNSGHGLSAANNYKLPYLLPLMKHYTIVKLPKIVNKFQHALIIFILI